jgi:hypothetical protein
MTHSFGAPIFTNHNYYDRRSYWLAGKMGAGRNIRRLLLSAVFAAAMSTIAYADDNDVQWTELNPPGSGKSPTYARPFPGAPDWYPGCEMDPGVQAAWYRFCQCPGSAATTGCTISYYSLAAFTCPAPSKNPVWLMTSIGRTKIFCGEKAKKATRESWLALGLTPPADYDPPKDGGGGDPPGSGGDPPIGGIETPKDGKKPDEKTSLIKKADNKETTEKSDTGKTETKTPGTGTGQVEKKRPRKEVKHKTSTHRRAKINNDRPTSSGGVSPETANAISNIIGIAAGVGLSRSHGHTGGYNNRGDRPTKSVTPKSDN